MLLLLIDDDSDLRESLMDFLVLQGHTVHCAVNGREAIQWFKCHTTYPDLIFLDLMMPILDGWGFLLERSQNPQISIVPVVIMSGSFPAIGARAKAAGAAYVIQKPFGPEELLPVIDRFLPRREGDGLPI